MIYRNSKTFLHNLNVNSKFLTNIIDSFFSNEKNLQKYYNERKKSFSFITNKRLISFLLIRMRVCMINLTSFKFYIIQTLCKSKRFLESLGNSKRFFKSQKRRIEKKYP